MSDTDEDVLDDELPQTIVKPTKPGDKKSSGNKLSKDRFFRELKLPGLKQDDQVKVAKKQRDKLEKKQQTERKSEQKRQQKIAIRTSKDKPKYEDEARPALDRAIDTLDGLLGAEEHLEKLLILRVDAAKLATEGNYSEAVVKLKPVSDLLKKGRETAKKATETVEKQFSKVFTWAGEVRKLLEEKGADLGDLAHDAITSEISIALSPLYRPGAGADEAEVVEATLDELAKGINRQANEAGRAKTLSGKQMIEASKLLGNLKPVVTTAEYARTKQLVDGAQTAITERDYVAASTSLAEALREGNLLLVSATTARDQWLEYEGPLQEQVKTARKLAADQSVPSLHDIDPTARAVRDGLLELANDPPPETVSYTEAVRSCQLLTGQLAGLEKRVETDTAFTPKRMKAAAAVLKASAAVDMALKQLHDYMGKMFPERAATDLDGPFEREREGAEDEWTNGMRRIDDMKVLLTLSTKVQQRLYGIAGRIADVCRNVGVFTDAVAARDLEIARKKFAVAHKACLDQIDALMAMDIASGIHRTDILREITADMERAQNIYVVDEQTKRATALAERTERRIANKTTECEEAQKAVVKLLGEVEVKLKAFTDEIAKKSKIDWLREPTKEKDYGELRDAFKDRLDQQRPFARMLETELLEECTGELTEMGDQLDTAIGSVKGDKDAKGCKIDTFAALTTEVAALGKRIDKHDMSKYLTERQLGLAEQVELLSSSLRSMPIEKAREKVDDFAKDVADAELAAAEAKKIYKKFEQDTQKLRKTLKGEAFKSAADYRDALGKEIDKLLGDVLAGGVTTAVTKAFTEIETEVNKAATEPQARNAGQEKAGEDKRKAELEAAEWKSRHEIVVEAVSKATTIFTKERGELMELAKAADDVYKKSKDMQAATMQLRIVNDRLNFLQKYPDGMEVAARNSLPRLRDRWKQSIGDLKGGLDGLIDTIGNLDPVEVPPKAVENITGTITAVKNLFNPVVFDQTVDAMAGKTLSRKELSAAREKTLRAVHQVQAVIGNDPRMRELSRNPFKPGLDRLIANANLALAELETNLLISL